MTKVIEKDHQCGVLRGAAKRKAQHPVLTYFAIARRENNGLELVRVPLKSGREVLPVFSSRGAAQNFILSNTLGWEWYARECSTGELVSLLLTLYVDVEWVLLDPVSGFVAAEEDSANLMRWENFVDYLLG